MIVASVFRASSTGGSRSKEFVIEPKRNELFRLPIIVVKHHVYVLRANICTKLAPAGRYGAVVLNGFRNEKFNPQCNSYIW